MIEKSVAEKRDVAQLRYMKKPRAIGFSEVFQATGGRRRLGHEKHEKETGDDHPIARLAMKLNSIRGEQNVHRFALEKYPGHRAWVFQRLTNIIIQQFDSQIFLEWAKAHISEERIG
jgi:hypothetical protein